jgi:transcriptional regulator with XRE-family HTH domain
MTTPDELGMRIKRLRERRKWTQEKLAKEAGISRAYLARLETGRHDPPLSMLTKLADALGVKLSRLVD